MDTRRLFGQLHEAERALGDAEQVASRAVPSSIDPRRRFQGYMPNPAGDVGHLSDLPPDHECTLHQRALKRLGQAPHVMARLGTEDHDRIIAAARRGWARRMHLSAAEGDADAARRLREFGR